MFGWLNRRKRQQELRRQELHRLLERMDAVGIPTQMTSNLLRIAQENGVVATPLTNPRYVIDALRWLR